MAAYVGLPYFGSKAQILDWTLSHIPRDTKVFCDVFGGSGMVTMNLPHYTGRIYNDLSNEVLTLLDTIENRADELHKLLMTTPYHRGYYL
jgi:site-specific DNA-adenine methylase